MLALALNVTSDQLVVTWQPPSMPNGVVSYTVNISAINLANDQAISIDQSSAVVTETMYSVSHSSVPYSNYTVMVLALTIAGSSDTEEVVSIQTPEAGEHDYTGVASCCF